MEVQLLLAEGEQSWSWLIPVALSIVGGVLTYCLRIEKSISNLSARMDRHGEDRKEIWSEIEKVREENMTCTRERGEIRQSVSDLSRAKR